MKFSMELRFNIMSYRKLTNKNNQWILYCKEHKEALEKIGLDFVIFENESNFREYATTGCVKGKAISSDVQSALEDSKFWLLHDFITEYFEMDVSLFDSYEESRIARKESSEEA